MGARTIHRHASAGLSVVELLAGLAVGLVVVAAATVLLASGAHEARRTVLDTRLMQDLRAATDHVARGLRRAGHWGEAGASVGAGAAANPYAEFTAGNGAASFRFSRDVTENGVVDGNEQFGFRLRAGVVEMQLGSAGWQAMTDAGSLTVTALRIVPQVTETSLEASCANPCPAGSTTCPPRHQSRSVAIEITGRAPTAAAVTRHLATEVRLRNDLVVGTCNP
jgi:type IV pilus assembly protein PilW